MSYPLPEFHQDRPSSQSVDHKRMLLAADPSARFEDFTVDTIVFHDGSKYTGTLKNGLPDGLGTCIWKDHNQYDGEWRNGVMHGFGTYLWTSGQRYDGEWRDGKRNGIGVKMYADGATFDGFWREGKKHGVGVFRPAPPTREEKKLFKSASMPIAKRSSLSGPAAAAAVASAPGVAGEEEKPAQEGAVAPAASVAPAAADAADSVVAAAPHPPSPPLALGAAQPGSTCPDGAEPRTSASALTVHWQTLSAPGTAAPGAESNGEAGAGSLGQGEAGMSWAADQAANAEGKVTVSPFTAVQPAPDVFGFQPGRTPWDGRVASGVTTVTTDSTVQGPTTVPEKKQLFIRTFDEGRLVREEKLSADEIKTIFGGLWEDQRGGKIRRKMKRVLGMGKKLQEKKGQLLYKGMIGYDLMIRLQLGIRYSIGKMAQPQLSTGTHTWQQQVVTGPPPKLEPEEFHAKSKVFFPSAGSNMTPAHPSSDFKWKDYSPHVFRNLRTLWGLHDAEYMLSLGGSAALRQLNSPGKSGCLFFLSDDETFIVKTMRKSEIHTLIEMLPEYYKHMESNPDALVTRFYGVYGVKQVHGRTVRFVVMSNIFNTGVHIHRKFDLKGSTEGRTAGNLDPTDVKTVYKDLDLNIRIRLPLPAHERLMAQIKSDADFLHRIGVMDYSLLLGVHFVGRKAPGEEQLDQNAPRERASSVDSRNGAAAVGPRPNGTAHDHVDLEERQSNVSSPGPAIMQVAHTPSPGGGDAPNGGTGTGGGGADLGDGLIQPDRAKNFDVFSNQKETARVMVVAEQRMRDMGFDDQRIQDVLGLAKLKILGDKLKSKRATRGRDKSRSVIKALQQFRQDIDVQGGLDEGGTLEGMSDDEETEVNPSVPAKLQLGFNMPALAVPKGGGPPEEVIICFGIIDILQDWNVRKAVERAAKKVVHDGYAISVAPPKLYSSRFCDFMTKEVFAEPQPSDSFAFAQMALANASFASGGQASLGHYQVFSGRVPGDWLQQSYAVPGNRFAAQGDTIVEEEQQDGS